VPKTVDADYLQSVLGVEKGAAGNLLSPLKAVGLIDENGALTDLAQDWRADDLYPSVCNRMLEKVYPDALRNAFPPPDPDAAGVKAWFMRNAKIGEAAARGMAGFYMLLCDADVKGATASGAKKNGSAPTKSSKPARPAVKAEMGGRTAEQRLPPPPPSPRGEDPSLHIDIQIHIPSAATAEQIDAIFSSMAKHLYRRT